MGSGNQRLPYGQRGCNVGTSPIAASHAQAWPQIAERNQRASIPVMDNTEQRDFAEEEANRQLMREEPLEEEIREEEIQAGINRAALLVQARVLNSYNGMLRCRRCDLYVGLAATGIAKPPADKDHAWLANHCWICRRSRAEIIAAYAEDLKPAAQGTAPNPTAERYQARQDRRYAEIQEQARQHRQALRKRPWAFLVVPAAGGAIAGVYFDEDQAERFAYSLEGVVVELRISTDFRRPQAPS